MATWQANLLLLITTAVWGSSFVIVKQAVAQVPPLLFIALRFWVGAAGLALVYRTALRSAETWVVGGRLGLLLFGSFALQTFGLQSTTSAKAGFITGLNAVFVPIGSTLLLRRSPRPAALAGVVSATLGLGLLSLPDHLVPDYGDLLVLLCALGFAAHILALGASPERLHPGALATVQLVAGAVAASLMVAFLPGQRGPVPGEVWPAILSMGLFATAGAYLAQTLAQRHTSPTDTALIFLAEPVFAAMFAYLWLGETMPTRAWVGAGLILAGMAVAQSEVHVHAARVARHVLRGFQLLALLVRAR